MSLKQSDRTARFKLPLFVGLVLYTLLGLAYLAPPTTAGFVNVTSDSALMRARGAEKAEKLAQLRLAVRRSPLYQDALFSLYDAEKSAKADDWMPVLARTGWRQNDAQIALIRWYSDKGDYPRAIARVDGMLRRGRRQDELLEYLSSLEDDKDFRPPLLRTLAARPDWRKLYFVYTRKLKGPRQWAHGNTALALARMGAGLTPSELAYAVEAPTKARNLDRAYQLWTQAGERPVRPAIILDDHVRAPFVEGEQWEVPDVPFQWVARPNNGYSVMRLEEEEGTDGGLSLRWNGSMRPVLLVQQIRLPRKPFRAKFHIVGRDSGSVPQVVLRLKVNCLAGGKQREEPALHLVSGNRDRLVSDYVDMGREGCRYAILELWGASLDLPRPIEVDFMEARAE